MNPGMLKRMLFGLVLIGFGLLFLASQLGFIDLDWGDIFRTFWPVILIYVGFAGMASSGRNSSGLFWNGFVGLLGVLFLLRNLDFLEMDAGDIFKMVIPAAIILYGVKLIFGGSRGEPKAANREEARSSGHRHDDHASPPPPPPPPPSVLDERMGVDGEAPAGPGNGPAPEPAQPPGRQPGPGSAAGGAGWHGWESAGDVETRSGFIGDMSLGRDYWLLKPTNINLFIGDTVIDLTKAQIPYGETKLTVSAFIGDVKVLVPSDSDLSIKVNSSSFIGDIQVFDRHAGGFLRSIDEQLPDYDEADKKIFLQCNLFIGDIRIMRVG